MDLLAPAQAAEALGVSAVQVGRLIKAGELEAQRFGRNWVIDPSSLRRYQMLRPAPGRPLSEEAAWSHIAEAAPPHDLDAAIELARHVRRRSDNHQVRILPALLERLTADDRGALGGSHSAAHHGAAVGQPGAYNIYVHAEDANEIRNDYRAVSEGSESNVVLRIVNNHEVCEQQFVPPLVALLDLIDAADSRAASEALRVL